MATGAAIGLGVLGIGSSIASGISGSRAASRAADAEVEAARISSQTQLEMLDKIIAQNEPWTKAGEAALTQLLGPATYSKPPEDMTPEELKASGWKPEITGFSGGGLLGGPGDYTESDYNKLLKAEGLQATENFLASRGISNSGAAGKALTQTAENYAMAGRKNWLNEYYQSLNPWLSLAGVGQTATGQNINATQSAGTNISNNALYSGSARASGITGGYNALNSGIQSGLNNALMAYGMYQMGNK